MNTPIVDFVCNYNEKGFSRFHMPGHKGKGALGIEKYDITEIDGADVLHSASGIINESENNASELFGTAHSFYSAEGSSLAIKAMLSLVCSESDEKPLILASRNAHKAFMYTCSLIDFKVQWLYGEQTDHLCKCTLTAKKVEWEIDHCPQKPTAVYITSPDYLGNVADIKAISEVCDRYGIPLLVDNAHGAYRAFLKESQHPIALGASMCCDSAHKTLPCLTGGAYLHISTKAKHFCENAREHLSIFASTSPSYLIMQSLDLCNKYISEFFPQKLDKALSDVNRLKNELIKNGYTLSGNEELKITVECNSYGYYGEEIHGYLKGKKICCEYYDRNNIVFMFTPENSDRDFENLSQALLSLPKKEEIKATVPSFPPKAKAAMSARKALFSGQQEIDAENSLGKICADPSVSCPPAVPIVLSGEIITKEHIELMEYYGIKKIRVVK